MTPDSMTATNPMLHEPFLERAARSQDDPGVGGGHALGAFLTMRLVDQFGGDNLPGFEDALTYQITSTGDYVTNLRPQTVETGHLNEIVRAARVAHERQQPRILYPPMLAFAFWLEQEHRLAEALDVTETALRLTDSRDGEDEVMAHLLEGRLLRKLSSYNEATLAYREAAAMAQRLGDTHSEMLGRIGQGIVLEMLGNLPQARQVLTGVIKDALRLEDRDAEARARHDLSNVYMMMDRAEGAVPLAFRAFELYETEQQRVRALGDLGMAFKMLGRYQAAEDAFSVVLASSACTLEIRINTMLELLEIAAETQDRISFERWRRDLEALGDRMRPDAHVDLRIKLGTGWVRFGHARRGTKLLEEAIKLADEYELNAYLFRAEAALEDVADTSAASDLMEDAGSPADTQDTEALRIAEELHALRAAGPA